MKPKTKTAIQVPESITSTIIDAINSKKEKQGGERYELIESYKYYGQKPLPEGTTFTECNDGFFKIETPTGLIEHYRAKVQHIPSQLIKKI